MNYKNPATNNNDADTSSAEDEGIRALLGALNRVEAPKDFDFLVRSRIANASPAARQIEFLPVLRYVLPLAAVLLTASGFVFNSLYFADTQSVPMIADGNSQLPVNVEKSIQPILIESNPPVISAAPDKNEVVARVSTPAVDKLNNRKTLPENVARVASGKFAKPLRAKILPGKYIPSGGGTRLSALSQPNRIITPPGMSLNRTGGNTSSFVRAKSLSAKEVLLQLGVEADFTGDGWKVSAVQENSLAKRSSVKVGDSVEAIDGEKLTDKPLQIKSTGGKKLTVVRGGQKMEIPIGIKSN